MCAIVVDPCHSSKAAGQVGSSYHRWVHNRGHVSAMPVYTWITSAKRGLINDIRTYLAPQWASLTQASRDRWAAWAANNPRIDRFGQPYHPSAYGWYMKLNVHLLYHNAQQLDDPPDPVYPPFLATASAIPIPNAINVYWTLGPGELHYDDYIDLLVHYRPSFGRAPDRHSATIYSWPTEGDLSSTFAPAPPGNYTFWLRPTNLLSGLQVQEIRADCVQPVP